MDVADQASISASGAGPSFLTVNTKSWLAAGRLFSLFRKPSMVRGRQGAEFAAAPLLACSSEPVLRTVRSYPSKSKPTPAQPH
ncbi:hypothetical protein Vi05172_g5232 [Venturia inaequalis]|nr:hypothetical protein Vi05172_g5232 [Venturia inaequalis]